MFRASMVVWVGLAVAFVGCDKKSDDTSSSTSATTSAAPPPATSSAPEPAPTPVAVATQQPEPEVVDAAPPADAAITEVPAIADAAAPAATSKAENEADIARYPDEKKIDESAPIKAWLADANKSATASRTEVIATLRKGTSIHKIATHKDFVLGLYDDPSTAGRTLMAWFQAKVFTGDDSDAGVLPNVTCRAGWTPFISASYGVHCEIKCGGNLTCPADLACEADGVVLRYGRWAELASYCVHSKATPPKPTGSLVDAGATAVVDAAPPPTATADAAVVTTILKGPVKMRMPREGKCPGGYATTPDKQTCRLMCNTSADCGGGNANCRAKVCFAPGE